MSAIDVLKPLNLFGHLGFVDREVLCCGTHESIAGRIVLRVFEELLDLRFGELRAPHEHVGYDVLHLTGIVKINRACVRFWDLGPGGFLSESVSACGDILVIRSKLRRSMSREHQSRDKDERT